MFMLESLCLNKATLSLFTTWAGKLFQTLILLRYEVLLCDIIEPGRMKGKAYRGRKRLHMLSDDASSAMYQEVKRAAED